MTEKDQERTQKIGEPAQSIEASKEAPAAPQLPKYPLTFELHEFPRLYDSRSQTNFLFDVTTSRLLALHDTVLEALALIQTCDRETATAKLQGMGLDKERAESAIGLIDGLVQSRKLWPKSGATKAKAPDNFLVGFLNLNLAHACNLKCKYCFASQGSYSSYGGTGLMPWNVAKAAVDFLATQKLKKYEIGLFGGEPLLNRDVLFKVVPYAKEKLEGLHMMISTNGVNLDDEMATFLIDNKIHIQISCDGGPRLQNELRPGNAGIDSYKGAYSAAQLLRSKPQGDWSWSSRPTITSLCPSITDVLSQLFAMGFERANPQPISGMPEMELTDADLDHIEMEIKQIIRNGLVHRVSLLNGMLSKIINASRTGWFCSLGFNGVTVTPDGSMFACHRLLTPEYKVGDVWMGVDRQTLVRLFPRHSVDEHAPCSSCWARYLCGGGCYAENYGATGSLHKPWATRCRLTLSSYEAIIEEYVSSARQSLAEQAAQPAPAAVAGSAEA